MIPPEGNTMELENCQESRTKLNEEEENMLHFFLQGELNSFPWGVVWADDHIFFSSVGLSPEGQKMVMEPNKDNSNNRWRISSENTNISSTSSVVQDCLGIFAMITPLKKRGWNQVLSCVPKEKGRHSAEEMQMLACCKQRLAVMTTRQEHQETSGEHGLPNINNIFSKKTVVKVQELLHVLHHAVRKRRRACRGQIDRNPLWSPASLT